MSGGKIDIKDLPLCTDIGLYHYRAIGWENPVGGFQIDVVPGNHILDSGEHDLPPGDLKGFQERYGPFHACRLGNALYLGFKKPLGFGGSEKPFTNVPHCKKDQRLRRAMLIKPQEADCQDRPDIQRCLPKVTARHEMALIPSYHFDPLDSHIESLKNYLSAANAKDLCQKKNPDDKWALYWVDYEYRDSDSIADEVLSELEKIELKVDPESQREIHRRIVDEMPVVFRRCQASEAEQGQLEAQWLKLVDRQISFAEALADPSIRYGVVPGLAEILAAEVKFYDLRGDNRWFLENILSHSLHHGLSEQWIMSAANDLTLHSSEEQTFLYGLITLVVLEVAKKIHESNISEGGPGISPEFSDFVVSIDEAIRDGRIAFRVLSAADLVISPFEAKYDPVKNEIVFPPMGGVRALGGYMDSIVHECVHAYQDLQAQPLTELESELQAYERGIRAEYLYHASIVFDERAVSAQWNHVFEMHKIKRRFDNKIRKCYGADDEMINRRDTIEDEADFLMSEWLIEALGHPSERGVLSYPSELSAETFRKGYKLVNLRALANINGSYWMLAVGRLFDKINMAHIKRAAREEMLDELRAQMRKIEKELSKARFIFGGPPGTPEHAEAADIYLDLFDALSVYAYYLDRNRWKELDAQFYKEADFLGESLLYLITSYDGM